MPFDSFDFILKKNVIQTKTCGTNPPTTVQQQQAQVETKTTTLEESSSTSVIGLVGGGLVILALIVVLLVVVRHRRNLKKEVQTSTEPATVDGESGESSWTPLALNHEAKQTKETF